MQHHRNVLLLGVLSTLTLPATLVSAWPSDALDLAVDGSVHSQLDESLASPVGALVPLDGVSQSQAVGLRTETLVLPSPAPAVASAADALAPLLGEGPFQTGSDAFYI